VASTKLAVTILWEQWEENEPDPPPEKPGGKKPRKKKKPKEDREEIFDALVKLGHEPTYQLIDGRNQSLLAVARSDSDLVFNLAESYAGDDTKDMNVAAYLDLLGCAYTGAGPHALYLAQDKALAKKIFAFHGIKTPYFATSYRGKLDHSHDISFPLIVKPTSEDGSIGIDKSSVVGSVKELMEKIHYIHQEFDSPALIEEYIEGREIYAAILGNENPEALALVELDLSRLPEGTPRIAGKDVKWETETEAYKVTKSAPAEDLDEETTRRLSETAVAAYQALKLRDYGRIDMRLTEKGEVFVIEANPNPWLASSAEFAMAGRKSGRSYSQLIGEIVDLARARYTNER
jgi:D-alanine-D-alanine ligase